MIDTRNKPTAFDIAQKAEMLYVMAQMNVSVARDTGCDDHENIHTLIMNAELIGEISKELNIMAQVANGSSYSEYPELTGGVNNDH